MQLSLSDGTVLHYDIMGQGETTLVLINGLGLKGTVWRPLAASLKNRFQVVMVDNRGIGLTESAGPFTTRDMAGDIAALIAEVSPNGRAHVLGFSMGGFVAQHLAVAHPDRVDKLILVSTAISLSARSSAVIAHWCAMTRAKVDPALILRDKFLFVWEDRFFDREESITALIKIILSDASPQSTEDFCRQVAACHGHADEGLPARIRAETLVVTGPQERLLSVDDARQLAAAIPGARFELLPGGAHNAWVERLGEMTELVEAFLA
ncbi:alpha/beta fold hydrolase [Beijerinckia indica]|uniref:Alpha/beta hydrolase fold n=1 Tax=Beijerinckia indica subsp. indica (strain ATCC 9039 / DSM 1715 / NCIMB 8712) TaxID=395963 RepID=B2IEC3_BEII9|nr:alpha/beta hydrolase [Beijerinckia indica]ACB95521.1 alpha/beta hydrolase fold [Beijerinckia indica subsp. indica ATCC 9039]